MHASGPRCVQTQPFIFTSHRILGLEGDRLKRLIGLIIAFAMFVMFAPILHISLHYIFPYFASADSPILWPILLLIVMISIPPFVGAGYFWFYALRQSPKSRKWIIKYLPKTYLIAFYAVGIFFILENLFLLLFPQGYPEIQYFLYAVATAIVAFTPHLVKHIKKIIKKSNTISRVKEGM